MAVRQVSKKDGTKDGRRWYFYTYIRDITGNKKRYKSKKYYTQKEAERAERDFLTKVDKRKYHNVFIEGNNNFIKVIKRIAFGFRSFRRFKARIMICKGLITAKRANA